MQNSHTEEGACSPETCVWKIYGMSSVIVVFDFQFEFEIELITKYNYSFVILVGLGNVVTYSHFVMQCSQALHN